MADDPRAELARLWEEHLATPFPYEWSELEERFGWPSERAELRGFPDAERLLKAWGDPDLHLYDTYVAGHVSTVLTGPQSGAEVIGEASPDERLARYFEVCGDEATDEEMRRKIDACRAYFEHLNQMLDLARQVPAR
jgi:hypothetical protein